MKFIKKKNARFLKIYLLLITLFIFQFHLLAQNINLSFKSLNISKGLSQAAIIQITKDSLGFMWMGSLNGINRYDGNEIVIYRKINDSTGLWNNRIQNIKLDTHKKLWVATINGINLFNYTENKFIRIHIPEINKNNLLKDFIILKNNDLLILAEKSLILYNTFLSKSSKLLTLEDNKFSKIYRNENKIFLSSKNELFTVNSNDNSLHSILKIKEKKITKLITLNQDSIIVSGEKNIYLISIVTNKIIKKINPPNYQLKNISDLKLKNNNLYIGQEGNGLIILNLKTNKFQKLNYNSQKNSGLLSNYIRCIYIDNDDILWLGMINGVNWTSLRYSFFKNTNAYNSNGNTDILWSIFRDKNKHYWLGTHNKGIYRSKDTLPSDFEYIKSSKKFNHSSAFAFRELNSEIWIGSENGLYTYNIYTKKIKEKNCTSNIVVTSITPDDSSNLWLGTLSGLYFYQPKIDSLQKITNFNRQIITCYNYQNKLYASKINSGLYFLDIDNFYKTNKPVLKLLSNKIKENIFDIYIDKDRYIWLCGENHLKKAHLDTLKFKNSITLSGNQEYFFGMEEDSTNHLWISSGHGIYRYNKLTNEIAFFDEEEGLKNIEFNSGAHFQDKIGNIFFGGTNGLTFFNPYHFKQKSQSPNVYMLKINIFNNEIGQVDESKYFSRNLITTDSIYLNYAQNFFRLEYTSPEFRHSEKLTYAYRLSPLEKNWHYAKRTENFVQYTNLASGKYIFMVKIKNADGKWTKPPKKFYIFIASPIWRKPWFLFILILIILASIAIFIIYREKQLVKLNELLEKKVKQRTDLILKTKKDIQREKKFTDAIIDNALDGIAVLNIDGKFTRINTSFGKILGYTSEEILKNDYINLSPPKWRENEKKLIESLKRGEKVYAEKTFYHSSGKTISLEMAASPLTFDNQRYSILIIRDISERKRLEKELHEYSSKLESKIIERTKELNESKERAEAADKLKSDFLANLSHEIRTPMNAINGFAQLLGMEHVDIKQKKRFVQLILDNSSKLTRLIEDIVDLSKFENRQIEISLNSIKLKHLLKEIYDEYLPFINLAFRDLEIELKTPEEDIEILSDEKRLKQIIHHLLENAIKYTEKGKIILGTQIVGEKLNIFIEDQGIGIPPENLKKIFNVFEKPDFRKDKLYRGLGIGLALVKANTDILGGNILVESEIGKGTRFELYLPNKIQISEKNNDLGNINEISFEAYRFLIAEDEETNFAVLENILRARGASVVWAQNGEIAIEKFKSGIFDFIFMDLKMPIMDGLQATREIRKLNQDIPIMVITAFNEKAQTKSVLKARASFILNKPYKISELIMQVNKLLRANI